MITSWKTLDEKRRQIRKRVVEEIPAGIEISDSELRERIEREIEEAAGETYIRLEEKRDLRRMVFNSIRKMDVLQDILEDEEITEIMVNGPDHIFIEKEGRLVETGLTFEHQGRLEDIAQQIASAGNRIVNESNPILDARLADGSRVNIVVPPIAIEGPVITIRKFPKEALTMKKLIQMGRLQRRWRYFCGKW